MTDAAAFDEMKKKADDAGVKMVVYGVRWVPTGAKARPTLEWAKEMGIEVLAVNTRSDAALDKLCSEYNIGLAIHNRPHRSWTPEEILAACRGFGPLYGACADTGHWMFDERQPVDAIELPGSRVLHFHLKDRNGYGKGPDVTWGSGKADIKSILEKLHRLGYKGYVSIEYERGLQDAERDLPLCIEFFDKTTAEIARHSQ